MNMHGTWARLCAWLVVPLVAVGCGGPSEEENPQPAQPPVCSVENNPFATKVVSFKPGEDAGFGQDG